MSSNNVVDTQCANNTEEIGLNKQQKNKIKREAAKKKKQEQKQSTQTEDTKTIEDGNNSNGDVVDNFEEELCWCIQQLEIGLRAQKTSSDQVVRSRKLITQLRSNKTPKPKKRMLMKNNFGNYRDKMEKESKMHNATAVAKIIEVKGETIKKSVFIRKKVNDSPIQVESVPSPAAEFRFNFANLT